MLAEKRLLDLAFSCRLTLMRWFVERVKDRVWPTPGAAAARRLSQVPVINKIV